MKSSYEQLEPTQVKLTVEVALDEFQPEVDKAAKKIGNQVQIPGFRRGHVPERVLEAQIGYGTIVQEAVNDSIDHYYQQALTDNDLHPLGTPEVDVTSVPESRTSGEAFGFDVTVDVRPAIVIPDPATLTVEVDPAKVEDSAVEARLTDLRKRFGTLKPVTREAKDGDSVTLDLKAVIDGEEVDSVSGVSYTIGAGNMLDGMDEQLSGMKAGETATYTTKLVGGDHAGEEAEVTLTVEGVKEMELPEADDDFAQMASEFDTMDELRADLRKKAESDAEQAQILLARDGLLEQLNKAVDVPLSKKIIDDQVAQHLKADGLESDDKHGEEIRDQLADDLRSQLMLDVMAEKFNIQVNQDELFQFLLQQAQNYRMDPNKFINAAVQTGQLPVFSGELARGKALIAALRLATVKDTDGNEVDVAAVVGERPEGEVEHPDFTVSASVKAAGADKAEDAASDAEAAAFDPSDHKVDEVVAYAQDADAAERERVLAAEKAGKARKTLIEKLEKLA